MGADLRHQYKVGVFVALGICLVIASIYILGGQRSVFAKNILIHAHFDNVQGLNAGSLVSLSGIQVGHIDSIVFIPENSKLDVSMRIDSRALPRITEGSTVEIRTAGALGDKFVFISPGEPTAKPLSEGDVLSAMKASDLMGIFAEKGNEAGKIFDIIKELHKVVVAMNENNRTEKMITQLSEASGHLNKTAQESSKLISEIRSQSSPHMKSSMEKLDRILGKIDSGEGTLGALINDSSIHDQIKSMVGGSSRKKNLKNLIRGSIEKSSE